MKVTLLCGDGAVEATLPDRVRRIEPNAPLPALSDPRLAVRRAIEEPFGSPPLRELARGAKKVVIAFDDGAVPAFPVVTPDIREVALGVVLEELTGAGVDVANVTLLCANALHRKWTRRELARIVGETTARLWPPQRLICHDACEPGNVVAVGESKRGFEVRCNRRVLEADLTVYLNITATPFNGGWKSYVVGLSDFTSIRHHHRPWPYAQGHSVMDPKRSSFPRLLAEMGRVLTARLAEEGKHLFSIETAYDNSVPASPIAVHAGAPDEVHPVTLSIVEAQQVVEVADGPFDAAILGLPDRDPYSQGDGAFGNPILTTNLGLAYGYGLYQGQPLIRPGGALILVNPLPWRFDEIHHPSYRPFCDEVLRRTLDPEEAWDLFVDDFAHRPELVHRYRHGFGFHGSHPFFMWNQTLIPRRHLGRIIFAGVTEPGVAERLGFEGFATVEEAVGSVEAELGPDCSIALPCNMGMPMITRIEQGGGA